MTTRYCVGCHRDLDTFTCKGCDGSVCETCATFSAYFDEKVCPDCHDCPPEMDVSNDTVEAGSYDMGKVIVDYETRQKIGTFLGWKFLAYPKGFCAKIRRIDGTIDHIKAGKFDFYHRPSKHETGAVEVVAVWALLWGSLSMLLFIVGMVTL